MAAFESDVDHPFTAVKDVYTQRSEYYGTMQENVLAEAVASFRGSGGGGLRLEGSVKRSGAHGDYEMVVTPVASVGFAVASAPADLQLKDNVVDLGGTLFWVTRCEVDDDGKRAGLQGFAANGTQLQDLAYAGIVRNLRVRIFAGDYANRYSCAAELLVTPPGDTALERAILNPRSTAKGTYQLARPPREDLMPINKDQRDAVLGLCRRIEVIHGPPGTGKSTTIFHVLSSCLPARTFAAVTCVTNQAIDAVAEKLARCHDLKNGGVRMLVLGNPVRVGKTAGQYTLDALCKRDSLVVFMRRVLHVLTKTLEGLGKLEEARLKLIYRVHTSSRLSDLQLQRFPNLMQRYREQPRHFGQQRLSLKELHIEVINGIKKKMAVAVLSSRGLRLALLRAKARVRLTMASSCRPRSTLAVWNVHAFQTRVQSALKRAEAGLALARSTAPARTVRNTQVVLCTIPSSYRIAQLQADFPDDFPKHLFLGMLDEAGATAESYVPLLIRLGAENLVLLGDHKQLSPLVLASGGDRELEDKNVDRSLMERVLDCGLRPFPLREQYRMPPSLCDLVSDLFYEGALHTAPTKALACSMSRLGISRRGSSPLHWIEVASSEDSVGKSKVNVGEVAMIDELLRSDPVLSTTCEVIFIITFYKPQAALLQHVLERLHTQKLAKNVQVLTVDAAQGSEAAHVILSPVRSNSSNKIGFVENPRRLCVAISRAQESFTVVGNGSMLSRASDHWQQVVQHFGRHEDKRTMTKHALSGMMGWIVATEKAEDMAARSAARHGGKGKHKGDNGIYGGKGCGKGKHKGDNGIYGGKGRGKARTVCKFWAAGRCDRGESCTFLHQRAFGAFF